MGNDKDGGGQEGEKNISEEIEGKRESRRNRRRRRRRKKRYNTERKQDKYHN